MIIKLFLQICLHWHGTRYRYDRVCIVANRLKYVTVCTPVHFSQIARLFSYENSILPDSAWSVKVIIWRIVTRERKHNYIYIYIYMQNWMYYRVLGITKLSNVLVTLYSKKLVTAACQKNWDVLDGTQNRKALFGSLLWIVRSKECNECSAVSIWLKVNMMAAKMLIMVYKMVAKRVMCDMQT